MQLPTPQPSDAVEWVRTHLGHLACDRPESSGRFVGGQQAADAALAAFDVSGYASRRNEVWPEDRRGASALSPYIRHGLLTLRRVWDAVDGGPSRDVRKFRDELEWQEFSRHLYARVGRDSQDWIRYSVQPTADWDEVPWWREMACVDLAVSELETDGWLVNQTRMWLASQWTVRGGGHWRDGEDRFFRHLLDGSRAANRLGWLWTIGGGTGKPYGFSRWQVNKRAPGLCDTCALSDRCPIEDWPEDPVVERIEGAARLKRDPDPDATAGPSEPSRSGSPEAVWITAESLGDEDPALSANPDLPVVFVFDDPLLDRLRLSGKRLVFLTECLADLAERRDVEVRLGGPTDELDGRSLATTFAPVPGWGRIAGALEPVEVHPWPWLRRPGGGSVASFSQWARS